MSNRYLACLRLARVRCNGNIVHLESSLAFQRSRRKSIEAAILDLEPELRLPPNRKPNPVFDRNKITRLALNVLRDAGKPFFGVAEIAICVLAVKGLPSCVQRHRKSVMQRVKFVLFLGTTLG